MMREPLDEAILIAAVDVVENLSPKARQRLADGAHYVRVDAYYARRLIAAVDELDAAIAEEPEP